MSHRNVLLSWALGALLGVAAQPLVGVARTWQSKDGRFKTEAELLQADATSVRLKKPDGQEINVPLEKLSDQDKRFVESWKKDQQPRETPSARSTPRAKPGPRKPRTAPRDTAARGAQNEPQLAPLKFKIFDDELTMQAPVGAKAEVQGVFPVVQYGDRFKMWIEPYSDTDLKEFKARFGSPSPAITLKKVLVQKDDALAYTVNVNAFNDTASAFMVVVTVGDKKYTCSDESLEDINRKKKYSAEDIELMIRCARTLTAGR